MWTIGPYFAITLGIMKLIPYRPISLIKNMLESIGQDISYAYDDLIFVEHNAFLLQMGDRGDNVLLHFNEECEDNWRKSMLRTLKDAAAGEGIKLRWRGCYTLEERENKEIAIHFQKVDACS